MGDYGDKLAALLIQVKNRIEHTKLDVFADQKYYEAILGTEMPVISILLDLGSKESSWEVCKTYSEKSFAFRVVGCTSNLYPAISPTFQPTIAAMLSSDHVGHGSQADVAKYSERINYHGWERYSLPRGDE